MKASEFKIVVVDLKIQIAKRCNEKANHTE
jgi:hypothetical protein